MKHLIHKQLFDLTVSDQTKADQLQRDTSAINREAILPALEGVFNTFPDHGQTVRIDSVIIDLGDIPLRKFKTELIKRIRERVQEKLAEIRIRRDHVVTGWPDSQTVFMDPVQNSMKLIHHFLNTGQLPWWFDRDEAPALESRFRLATESSQHNWRSWLSQLFNSPVRIKRFINEFNQPFALEIIGKWLGADPTELKSRLRETGSVLEYQFERINFRARDLASLIEHIITYLAQSANNEINTAVDNIIAEGFFKLYQKQITAGPHKETRSLSHSELSPNVAAVMKQIYHLANQKKTEAPKRASKPNTAERPTASEPRLDRDKADLDKPSTELKSNKTSATKSAETGDMVVSNAGLILLWPYLGRLFTSLKMIRDKQFVSPKERHRAIYLLHYLATGRPDAHEYDLTISKLLTGTPLDEIPERSFRISSAQKAACDELLDAFIGHWQVLKNTSRDGLRHTFIQRQGILELNENHLTIRIERTGVDILLDRLPFGLNMIRLSWLDTMIYVEW